MLHQHWQCLSDDIQPALEHPIAGHKLSEECRKGPVMAAAGGFASWAKSVWLHPAGASSPHPIV